MVQTIARNYSVVLYTVNKLIKTSTTCQIQITTVVNKNEFTTDKTRVKL